MASAATAKEPKAARAPRASRAPKAAPSAPAGPAAPTDARATGRIRVRATQLGYYGHVRRRPGDVFTIASRAEFSAAWMEEVDPRTPERVTTAAEALKQEHTRLRALKHAGEELPAGPHVGPDDVPEDLPQGEDNPLGAE